MSANRPNARNNPDAQFASGFAGDELYRDLLTFVLQASPDQRIASGRELSRQYGVSHSTVNAVIIRLAEEGHVYTVHGKGSFVADKAAANSAQPGSLAAGPTDGAWDTLVYAYVPTVMEQTYGARMMHGVAETARANRLHLQVWDYAAARDGKQNADALCASVEAGVSAFILPWIDSDMLDCMRRINPEVRVLATASVKPGQHIASVLLDMEDMGRQAATYLAQRGARRVVAVYRNRRFGEAVEAVFRQARRPKPVLIEHREREQTIATCRAILDAQADGLAFSDDRGALNILRLLVNEDANYLQKVSVVSHANAGEALLPVPVARLESDGYEIGATAVATLEAMKAGRHFGGAEVRLKSRLIEPDLVSLANDKDRLLDAS